MTFFRFFLIPLVIFCAMGSLKAQAQKKVALEIYFYDDIAIDRKSEDLFERIFARLRPDLEYRRISIKSSRWGRNKKQVSAELRRKMADILRPEEKMAFLLIDTHGNTEESQLGGKVTALGYVGKIYERGVDPDFEEVFAPVKGKADSRLQIILNSCSTFCGGEESAALRGKAMLDYFGATEGGIYGSNVLEISQSLDHPEFFRWKYIAPNLKLFLGVALTTTALLLPAQSYLLTSDLHQQMPSSSFFELLPLVLGKSSFFSVTFGLGAGAGVNVFKPIYQFIQSRLFANRGYYFALKNGKIHAALKVVKYKKIKNMVCETLLN